MTDQEIWNDDTPITDLDVDIEVPGWIEQDISPQDVAAIVQGGCESGAYMPAVTSVSYTHLTLPTTPYV